MFCREGMEWHSMTSKTFKSTCHFQCEIHWKMQIRFGDAVEVARGALVFVHFCKSPPKIGSPWFATKGARAEGLVEVKVELIDLSRNELRKWVNGFILSKICKSEVQPRSLKGFGGEGKNEPVSGKGDDGRLQSGARYEPISFSAKASLSIISCPPNLLSHGRLHFSGQFSNSVWAFYCILCEKTLRQGPIHYFLAKCTFRCAGMCC